MDKIQSRIYDYLIDKRTGAYLITGHAGTGKTYLAIQIIKAFVEQGLSAQVLCPTHQAKQQFTAKLEHLKGVNLTTVASFLTQFPIRDFTGRMEFQRGGYGGISHPLLIVDEVSMVSEYELKELLQARREALVIFLGDFAQLRPVMKKQGTLYQRLPTFKLLKQHRNANDILKLAELTRNQVVYPTGDSDEVIVHPTRRELVKHMLRRIEVANEPYNYAYLAYRNATVDVVAGIVHKRLYGDAPFSIGQYLRLDAMCAVGNNGTIVKILDIMERNKRVIAQIETRVYRLQLRNLDTNEIALVGMVRTEDQRRFKTRLEELYDLSGKYFKRDRAMWQDCQDQIDAIRNSVAFYSSPFAQTVHKAQGRSIPHVYLDTKDLSTGSDKQRLLYVGYSRAVKKLHTIKVEPKRKVR